MRTTVTLDPDVEHLLKETAHQTRQSFKKVLNQAVRTALGAGTYKTRRAKFVVKAQALGLKPAYQGMNLNHLAATLEDEEILSRMERSR